METKNFKINDNEYSIVNESWGTSRSWGHKSTLLKNGREISSRRVTYLNRTWESYQYRTVMGLCICDLMAQNEKEAVSTYKAENNVSRISKVKREEIESNATANVELKELYSKL